MQVCFYSADQNYFGSCECVYYFPAMDDWIRKIVRPLALHAFRRKIKEHRASYELLGSLDDAEIALWTRYGELGERLLEHYFAWCATVDDFESVLSDHELRAPVPDPSVAGRDLVAPDGRALRYVSRLDQLIAEGDSCGSCIIGSQTAGRAVESFSTIGSAYRRPGPRRSVTRSLASRQHLQRDPRRRSAAR